MKKYKYIDSFPKPFLEDLINNRCLPFIGAGFSKNADIPKGKRMLDWHTKTTVTASNAKRNSKWRL